MTTSSVSSTSALTAPTINTGNAQDVSSLETGNFTISLADEVTTKVQPYIDQATAVQTEINTNQTKIAAYQNMQGLLQTLQSAMANLSAQPLQGSDVFDSSVANLSSSNSSIAAGSILSATVASGTNTGTHTVMVNALAQAESDVSATQSVSSTAALNQSGSFTIAEQGKSSPVSVTVNAGMSLTDIANAINGATTQNGVSASVVSIDSGHSALIISGVDADTPLQFSDPDGLLSNLGVYSASSSVTGTTTEAAQGLSGTFAVNGGGLVNVTPDMTLSDIQSAIDTADGGVGVTASIGDDGNLTISAGSPLVFTNVSGNVLSGLNIDSTNPGAASSLTGTVPETAQGLTGSFTINGGSQPVSVTVNSGDSLSVIAANINSAASDAGSSVTASVVNDQLQIATGTASPISFSPVTGNALSGLGITANGALHQAQAPQAASLTVDGISGITRSSNTISDILSGVTLNLAQAAPGTTVTLNIAPNTTAVINAIGAFTTAYNNWESFVQQNEATQSDGTAATNAVLFGDSTLRDASLQIDSAITALNQQNNISLADIGITLDQNNNLQTNSTTLSQAMASNFSGVAGLFQTQLTTSSYTLQPIGTDFSNFGGSFSLGISVDGNGNITGLTLNDAPTTAFTFNGNTITGAAGTPYDGMSFTYTGTGETVTVSAQQGLANQVYTTADSFADPLTGSVQGLVTELQSQDTDYTSQYNTLVNEANDYTNFLLQQYAALTTQVETAGEQSNVLNALFSAQTSSSSKL